VTILSESSLILIQDAHGASWIQTTTGNPDDAIAVASLTRAQTTSFVGSTNAQYVWATTSDGDLLRFNLGTKKMERVGASVGTALLADGENFYAIRPGLGSASLLALSGPEDPTGMVLAPLPQNDYKIILHGTPYVALQDQSGRLMVIDPGKHAGDRIIFDTPATAAKWQNSNGKLKLLGSDGHDLWIFDPGDATETLITRSGNAITDFALHPDGAHVLYLDGGVLRAIELDERDRRNTAGWDDLKDLHNLYLFDRGRRTFVVGSGSAGQGLYQVDLE